MVPIVQKLKDLFPGNIFKWQNSGAGRVFAVSSIHTISPLGPDPRRQPGYTASRSITTLSTDAGEAVASHIS